MPTQTESGDHTDSLHVTAAQRLRSQNLRYTSSRRALVEILAASDRPLTIPEILEQDSELAQSSAYRNLTELIQAGVVHRLIAGDEYSHFELAEDLTAHHHHLVCTQCGRVADITLSDEVERSLDLALEAAAASVGFRAEQHRLDLIGHCAGCVLGKTAPRVTTTG
ncbi:MAG: Fur family transcriptional regulator [Microthrixaceae bacterium]